MYLVCQQLSGSRLDPTGNSLFTVEYVGPPSQSYINDTQTHITPYKTNCLIFIVTILRMQKIWIQRVIPRVLELCSTRIWNKF